MKLYHGSNIKIDKIDLAKSKPYKDEVINKTELLERLKFMKGITFQYFFGSKEAIEYLTIL